VRIIYNAGIIYICARKFLNCYSTVELLALRS